MTLFSYEIFDAVARQGSFNKAAQQLHLTPSAISHAIAVMEAELGFTLFNRGKNGVTMTSYGASLYPSIRAVLNSDEALQQSIARLNGLEKGKVKLGARYNWNKALKAAGLPPVTIHSARHWTASMTARANMPDDARTAIMGHTSISMTNHYTHRDAASLAALLDRAIPDLHDERDVIDAQVIEEGK